MLALATIALITQTISTQAGTRVLPFQGRLTDANGNALPDGSRVVQFKIYDAPVGGQAVWNGEVHNLTVNAGLVSTLLGTKATLSNVDFNRDLYLELTIDANGDGQISLFDPPLLPRQSVLPAVFAWESANTQLLAGYDWSPLFGTNNPAEGTLLASKIADSSLVTAKIQDGAITTSKIPNGAITRPKLDTTGALSGQSLMYNGSQVVWAQVNALNADTLDGFDWATIFTGANPASGTLSVANVSSRNTLDVTGSSTLRGNVSVQGTLFPRTVSQFWLADNAIYLRGYLDFNHGLFYANSAGTESGFDGPVLEGVGGGVLGTGGNYTLRWNANGSVKVRGTISSGSDRNIKEHFATVDAGDVLARVAALPITRWNYKDDPSAQHIGPVAQDFRAAFGLGSDDKSIATVDTDGVALVAIQGLNAKVESGKQKAETRIEKLEAQNAELQARLEKLEQLLDKKIAGER